MDIKKELLNELEFNLEKQIEFVKSTGGLKIIFDGDKVTVYYSSITEYCRAFLIIKSKGFKVPYEFNEKCAFNTLGFMIDCSRGAVLNYETVKKLIRILSLLGYNELMLYTEDTYEVDDEPYFGHLRGKYTQQELKSLTEYGEQFGVELVPCIQTLAHLNTLPKWGEYSATFDLGDILFVNNERTYVLIENMFKSLKKCYKTDKIHIGMDEAHLLGLGKYHDKYGYKQSIEIFNEHLIKVRDIAKKYGFKPMIWSDMFFRSVSCGKYMPFPEDTMKKIKEFVPSGVDLVCWDYYNTSVDFYRDFIDCHKMITDNVIFANGLWAWQGFVPHVSFTLESIKLSTRACIDRGVSHLFSTCWGDDGAECSIFAVLPMLCAQSELAYNDCSLENLNDNFKALTDVDYEYFKNLENANRVGNYPLVRQNPSKYMLYNDPLMGVVDCLVVDGDKERLKDFLEVVDKGDGKRYSYLFDSIKALVELVYFKYDLGVILRKAYKEDDKQKLQEFVDKFFPELLLKIDKFYSLFRARWYKDNKPFGFDVQDIRIGGLIQRVKNAIITISEYLKGEKDSIPELEQEVLNFHCNVDYEKSITLNHWGINASCGRIVF